MLYEMIVGTLLHGESHRGDGQEEPPRGRPILATPSVPEGLVSVVMKLLERDPVRRYQHAIDALQALLPYAEVISVTMPIGLATF